MKKILFTLAGILLFLSAGCRTAEEKERERLTLPRGHQLPRMITSETPEKMALYFLSSGLSANSRTVSGVPVLILAAARGEVKITQFLMDKGADKEAADLNGCRAIHAASSCGHTSTVALLVKYGADINAPGSHGRTPLMEAARTSRKEIIKLLLEKGAEVNKTDREGRTALMHAATSTLDDPSLLELLLRHGADSSLADKEERTALMHAALNGNAKCAAFLLKDQPDFSSGREALGLLIMKCAIDGKNPELVKLLIRKKVPLNWNQSFVHNSLRRIKTHGLYRILVRQGVFSKRRSPLMWAALNNNIELIEILLDAGANPLQKDENGNTAYELATERRTISLLKKAEKKKLKEIEETQGKRIFRSKMFQ